MPIRRLAERIALAAFLGCFVAVAAPASASTFTGAWAPTSANGFNNAHGSGSTMVTTVSPDGSTLTSVLDNGGNTGHPSFFLENYANLLPPAVISFDWSVTVTSPSFTGVDVFGGFLFTDFGTTFVSNGNSISGTAFLNYHNGYFGYFGLNITDFSGTAHATVVLSNLAIPEPASVLLVGAGLLGLGLRKRARPSTTSL